MDRVFPPAITAPAVNGLATAAWIAVPDYAQSRWSRAALRAGVIAGTVVAATLLDRADSDPLAARPAREQSSPDHPAASVVDRFGPAKGAALLSAGLSSAIAINRFGSAPDPARGARAGEPRRTTPMDGGGPGTRCGDGPR